MSLLAHWADNIRQDLTYTLRGSRRAPGFTAMVVTTLALGVGANTALFSLADRLFLRQPAGVSDPASLRRLYARSNWSIGGVTVMRDQFNYPAYAAMRQSLAARAHAVAYTPPDSITIGGGDAATNARGVYATSDFLPTLGARVALGRVFNADEDRMSGGALVAVIGHSLWRDRFGSDSTIIGRVVTIARQRYTIVGVMTDGFTGADLDAVDVWLPLASYPAPPLGTTPWYMSWRSGFHLRVVARLSPTTENHASNEWISSVATATYRRGELENVKRGPDTATVLAGPILTALGPSIHPQTDVAITARLIGVALIVLLIACANVANLLLARALKRRREIAVRLALGVSRARLVVQLLTEGVVLAIGAGVVALVIGVWGGTALQRMVLPSTEAGRGALDLRMATFSFALALVTGILASLSPALRASAPDLTSSLKAGSRDGAIAHTALRSTFVIVQAALSVILLVGAGLFVRSLGTARDIDLGFDSDRVLFGTVHFLSDDGRYVDYGSDRLPEVAAGLASVAERLGRTRGVQSVALATAPPMAGYAMARLFLDGGVPVPRLDSLDPALIAATPSYFATTGIRLARGRLFTVSDNIGAEPVIVINETTARAYWPGREALGQCLSLFAPTAACTRVIGVVHDFHFADVVEKPMVGMIVPVAQQATHFMSNPSYLLVRSAPRSIGQVALITRQALRDAFPAAEPPSIGLMSQRVDVQLAPWRLGASLFSIFGVLALVVAAIGVYSVIAYSVSQRTHEMGVRVALGARGREVMSLVIGEGMRTVLVGIALGVAASLALGRLVESMLFATSPHDPLVLVAAAAILTAVALAASALPAWRASRVDPAIALRTD